MRPKPQSPEEIENKRVEAQDKLMSKMQELSEAAKRKTEQLAVFPCCYAFLLAIRCWNCCAGLLLFGSMQEVTHSVDYERCALFPSLFPDEVRRCTW